MLLQTYIKDFIKNLLYNVITILLLYYIQPHDAQIFVCVEAYRVGYLFQIESYIDSII